MLHLNMYRALGWVGDLYGYGECLFFIQILKAIVLLEQGRFPGCCSVKKSQGYLAPGKDQ